MNTIISLNSDNHNSGKTSTLTILRDLFISDLTYTQLPGAHELCSHDRRDFIDVFTKNGAVIGISSTGDVDTLIKHYVDKLINKYKCQIIFTASGTTRYAWGRPTVNAIESYNNFIKLYKLKTQAPVLVTSETTLTTPYNVTDANILFQISEQLVK